MTHPAAAIESHAPSPDHRGPVGGPRPQAGQPVGKSGQQRLHQGGVGIGGRGTPQVSQQLGKLLRGAEHGLRPGGMEVEVGIAGVSCGK